jgi:rhodanese-related sulfurtransferase
MSYASITARQLYDKIQAGEHVELIDVRTPAEFREVHATIAKNVPLEAMQPQQLQRTRNGAASNPLFVICLGGGRSSKACEKLLGAGCQNVINVEGGTRAWEAAGLPVVRGKKSISVERQVRIAAGLLILIGSLLAYLIHPAWIALPAIMGAGLAFAGITDTCGMGMLLARMPWNQGTQATSTCDR